MGLVCRSDRSRSRGLIRDGPDPDPIRVNLNLVGRKAFGDGLTGRASVGQPESTVVFGTLEFVTDDGPVDELHASRVGQIPANPCISPDSARQTTIVTSP